MSYRPQHHDLILLLARVLGWGAASTAICLWLYLLFVADGEGITGGTYVVGAAMIALACLAAWGTYRRKAWALVVAFAGSFVPIGVYTLGLPGIMSLVGYANIVYLLVAFFLPLERHAAATAADSTGSTNTPVRLKLAWSLWAVAGVVALGWGVVFARNDLLIGSGALVLLVAAQGVLGLALAARQYPVFWALVGLYVAFTICSAPSGYTLRTSALLLFVAALLTVELPADDAPRTRQEHNGG